MWGGEPKPNDNTTQNNHLNVGNTTRLDIVIYTSAINGDIRD